MYPCGENKLTFCFGAFNYWNLTVVQERPLLVRLGATEIQEALPGPANILPCQMSSIPEDSFTKVCRTSVISALEPSFGSTWLNPCPEVSMVNQVGFPCSLSKAGVTCRCSVSPVKRERFAGVGGLERLSVCVCALGLTPPQFSDCLQHMQSFKASRKGTEVDLYAEPMFHKCCFINFLHRFKSLVC